MFIKAKGLIKSENSYMKEIDLFNFDIGYACSVSL